MHRPASAAHFSRMPNLVCSAIRLDRERVQVRKHHLPPLPLPPGAGREGGTRTPGWRAIPAGGCCMYRRWGSSRVPAGGGATLISCSPGHAAAAADLHAQQLT